MNFYEIKEVLFHLGITPKKFADENYDRNEVIAAVGRIREVERKGGSGVGDEWYQVTHFVDHDVFMRINAYYDSYEGKDFSDSEFTEVIKREKVVTVFETR